MDQNLLDFEKSFIPLLKYAKERGLTYRNEQCPMPGWTTKDNWHNNIAYTPGTWIALHRICEKHGVGDQFRIHYDPSHAILMGQDTRSLFQYLKDEGYNFLIGGFHVKGQVTDAKGVSAWGMGGQTLERGDWKDGQALEQPRRPGERLEEAGRALRARAAGHGQARSPGLPAEPHRGLARPPARRARAPEARREEHPPRGRARVPEGADPGSRHASKPILQGSIAFTRKIDEAAACMYALQHDVLGRPGHSRAGPRTAGLPKLAGIHDQSHRGGRMSQAADRHAEYDKSQALRALSVIALVTAGVSFSLRSSVAEVLRTTFFDPIDKLHSAEMIGAALGVAFLGFAFTIALASPVLDNLGHRPRAPGLEPLLHRGHPRRDLRRRPLRATFGIYRTIWLGMLLTGVGWGLVETAINPLAATLYPDEKTHRLNVLHAWWPAGIIIGGLVGLARRASST